MVAFFEVKPILLLYLHIDMKNIVEGYTCYYYTLIGYLLYSSAMTFSYMLSFTTIGLFFSLAHFGLPIDWTNKIVRGGGIQNLLFFL